MIYLIGAGALWRRQRHMLRSKSALRVYWMGLIFSKWKIYGGFLYGTFSIYFMEKETSEIVSNMTITDIL